MSYRRYDKRISVQFLLLTAVLLLLGACKSTKHLSPSESLLVKNKVIMHSDHKITQRQEIKDNLNRMIIQKPNTNAFDFLPFKTPLRLWRYNRRYNKLHNRPDSSLPKSVERPVILDTMLIQRTVQNMKTYLFNQGYYYAIVKDTYMVSKQKASVTYDVTMGPNYVINNVRYYIDDSEIAAIVESVRSQTILKKGREFTYSLTADERTRLTAEIRNMGYYKFTLENITFIVDTVDKAVFRDIDDPFKKAMDFLSDTKEEKKRSLDLELHIHVVDDSNAFTKYRINTVHVYPDYRSPKDLKDTSLIIKKIDSIEFRYHNNYIHPKVLYQHIFIEPGANYSQVTYDKTQSKLTELGIFQYVRILPRETRRKKGVLDYDIVMARAKKYDFSTLYELSSGSTYALGHSLGISFRDKNFMKGANLLSIGVNGGLELSYSASKGKGFIEHFDRLTNYYGINASIDFPKFIAPVPSSLFTTSNLPHTIIGGGKNVIDRINYFTLVNTSANFTYSWRESQTKTWTLSPAFVNIIDLPVKTDSFNKVLALNDYLRNSYKENFIEGENITFTFDNLVKKHSVNYSYLKLGFEEAGGLLAAANKLGGAMNDLFKLEYAQYTKFDFDARHYFTFHKTVFAVRFYGGLGFPSGQSATLPYIKQYFAGGPYSLRGWRIRTLGPGSFYDTAVADKSNQIDRTGDIKLEFNGEFRFPITMLFAGAIKMNGALFADVGNIWLARDNPAYPGGKFEFSTLGKTVAADLGIGTRFDIASFLTLRVDVAMPVKKPYLSTNDGWVFDQIRFSNDSWRSDNLVLNISIGYPF